jgi:anti-sigma factor RsiW
MRLFMRGCGSHQAAYLAVADRLGPRQRMALETHAASCSDCADALRNTRPVDAALRTAFAPLRERRTRIAPGRVRLAVGPSSPGSTSLWLRAPRLLSRLAEISVMVAVTLLVAGSSLEPSQSSSTNSSQSVLQDYFRTRPSTYTPLTASDLAPLRRGSRFVSDAVQVEKAGEALPY